jgi:hypothetical protein
MMGFRHKNLPGGADFASSVFNFRRLHFIFRVTNPKKRDTQGFFGWFLHRGLAYCFPKKVSFSWFLIYDKYKDKVFILYCLKNGKKE